MADSRKVQHKLALIAASTVERRELMRGYAHELARDVEWQQFARILTSRRLMPVLGPRVVALAGDAVPVSFATTVVEAVDAAGRQGSFLRLVGDSIASRLADANIRSVGLKGPQLGEAIYGDAGRRLSSDIDLLVSPQELAHSVEVVRSLGYVAPRDHVYASGLPLLHFAMEHEEDRLPPVELHWRIHWYEGRFAHERLLPPPGSDANEWTPVLGDELIALLLFYARDGFMDLRLAMDIGAWWDAFGGGLDGADIKLRLEQYPALRSAVHVALRVAHRLIGLPTDRIIDELPRATIREQLADRIAEPNPDTSDSQVHADIAVVDGLLMPKGDFLSFVRRHVLLPSDVLNDYADRAQRWGAKSSLDYSLRVLARYCFTLVRAVRRR